jgi:hypothetical protein
MELDFALLADGVAQRPDRKLDIYGAGFDAILAPDVPARHALLALAVRVLLSRHEAEHNHELDVILQTADGAELARAHGELPPIDEAMRAEIPAGRRLGVGLILTFDNLVFPEYGAYQIVLQWDGNEIRSPLQLSVIPPPAG